MVLIVLTLFLATTMRSFAMNGPARPTLSMISAPHGAQKFRAGGKGEVHACPF
jgi:hypothetical protein